MVSPFPQRSFRTPYSFPSGLFSLLSCMSGCPAPRSSTIRMLTVFIWVSSCVPPLPHTLSAKVSTVMNSALTPNFSIRRVVPAISRPVLPTPTPPISVRLVGFSVLVWVWLGFQFSNHSFTFVYHWQLALFVMSKLSSVRHLCFFITLSLKRIRFFSRRLLRFSCTSFLSPSSQSQEICFHPASRTSSFNEPYHCHKYPWQPFCSHCVGPGA